MPTMATSATDISTYALESTFTNAGASIQCPDCRMMLHNRIEEVKYQWTTVKASATEPLLYGLNQCANGTNLTIPTRPPSERTIGTGSTCLPVTVHGTHARPATQSSRIMMSYECWRVRSTSLLVHSTMLDLFFITYIGGRSTVVRVCICQTLLCCLVVCLNTAPTTCVDSHGKASQI